MTGKTQYRIFETAGGPCGIAWTAAGVVRFQLPGEDAATTRRLLLRLAPLGRGLQHEKLVGEQDRHREDDEHHQVL